VGSIGSAAGENRFFSSATRTGLIFCGPSWEAADRAAKIPTLLGFCGFSGFHNPAGTGLQQPYHERSHRAGEYNEDESKTRLLSDAVKDLSGSGSRDPHDQRSEVLSLVIPNAETGSGEASRAGFFWSEEGKKMKKMKGISGPPATTGL
ncbi:MAG: hypothetical protein R6V08_09275, partial [Desulfuromonadales bacterium]